MLLERRHCAALPRLPEPGSLELPSGDPSSSVFQDSGTDALQSLSSAPRAKPAAICGVFATFLQNLSFCLPAVPIGAAWERPSLGLILMFQECRALLSLQPSPYANSEKESSLAIAKANAALCLARPGTAAKPAEIGELWKTQCHRVALLLVPACKAGTEAWCPHASPQSRSWDIFPVSYFFTVCNDVLSV